MDDLERVIRRLEAERYDGTWWSGPRCDGYAGDDAIATLNAEIAESDRTNRKATEARRAAQRAARIQAWKNKRRRAG